MTSVEAALQWLSQLPQAGLLLVMAVLAAIENIFPPIPADALVAFGGFLAARAGRAPWPAFLAVWGGNMLGAWLMYLAGARYGSAQVERRYKLDRTGAADLKVLAWHKRYGTLAFFVTRFIPGVRSVVPPVAGALRLPAAGVMSAMGAASAIWYGAITWLAFRAGDNWEALRAAVARFGSWSSVAGAVLALGLGGLWWHRRRRHGRSPIVPPAR